MRVCYGFFLCSRSNERWLIHATVKERQQTTVEREAAALCSQHAQTGSQRDSRNLLLRLVWRAWGFMFLTLFKSYYTSGAGQVNVLCITALTLHVWLFNSIIFLLELSVNDHTGQKVTTSQHCVQNYKPTKSNNNTDVCNTVLRCSTANRHKHTIIVKLVFLLHCDRLIRQ